MDGSDINSCDRSPSSRLLATADDFGKVKVFRYPCIQEGSQANTYIGHSSHVTSVRWINQFSSRDKKAPTDDYLISTGGEDKCVFQWRNSGIERGGGDAAGGGSATAATSSHELEDHSEGSGSGSGLDEAPTGGDEFTAVKAWLGAIVTPSAWANPDPARAAPYHAALGELSAEHSKLSSSSGDGVVTVSTYAQIESKAQNVFNKLSEAGIINSSAPDSDELDLEWVHGYRGFDCRNNVRYVLGGTKRYVVYHAAALGIVLDPEQRTQRFFKGHTDDIMSMAVYVSTDTKAPAVVATGIFPNNFNLYLLVYLIN